ncbi:hypothetical protein [Streptococcus dentiloxodontae]
MTSYIGQCLERHFQNYLFTHAIYSGKPELQASLYANTKTEMDQLAHNFEKVGFPHSEISYYTLIYKSKIKRFYFAQLSPVVC